MYMGMAWTKLKGANTQGVFGEQKAESSCGKIKSYT